MQRVLLSSARVIAGITIVACGADRAPSHGDETTASIAEPLAANQFFGTSLPAKTIALTFDDGPGDRTRELSTYLKNEGIRAAFFIVGGHLAATKLPNPNYIEVDPTAPATLAQLKADGHLVGNHTTTHRDLVTEVLPKGAAQVVQELTEADNNLAPYTYPNKLLFRAPYVSWSTAAYNALKDSPMNKYVGPINAELGGLQDNYPNSAADWACWQGQLYNAGGGLVNGNGYATTQQCGDAYINEITKAGRGVVLMHDPYGWAQGSTVDMVKYIVPKLKAHGYSFVRLDEVPDIAKALPPCDASCATCSGPGANQCDSCAAGKFVAAGTCTTCSTCAAGTFQATACTATANAVCTACHATCATCTGPASTDCATCGLGRYLNHGTCAVCTQCKAGTFVATTCTATTDTVCAPCPAGTSAPFEGATDCTSCGDCEDGDECTADSCDAVLGCVHVPDAACEAKKDAGADSGSDGSTNDASTRPPGTDADADDGGSDGNGSGTNNDQTTDAGHVDSGTSGGCNTGPRRGGQGAIVLGALAWLLARRRRPVRG